MSHIDNKKKKNSDTILYLLVNFLNHVFPEGKSNASEFGKDRKA